MHFFIQYIYIMIFLLDHFYDIKACLFPLHYLGCANSKFPSIVPLSIPACPNKATKAYLERSKWLVPALSDLPHWSTTVTWMNAVL